MYLVMSGNIVINIIVADSIEKAEEVTGFICKNYVDGVGIGYIYNEESDTFSAPEG